jgi:hypothetical protein
MKDIKGNEINFSLFKDNNVLISGTYEECQNELQRIFKIRDFLDEISKVCIKYGLSLSHEDTHGAFEVEIYNKDLNNWLQAANVGMSISRGRFIICRADLSI